MGVACFQKCNPILFLFVRKLRTQKWPRVTPRSGGPSNKLRAQVSIWQRRTKWLRKMALADEDLVVVNMDETAVQQKNNPCEQLLKNISWNQLSPLEAS